MKFLIWVLIIVGAVWGMRELAGMYRKSEQQASERVTELPPTPPSNELPGLLPSLENTLQAAEREGPAAMKDWLKKYRPYVRDPRLAAIELDYVVLVSRTDVKEARRVFQSVKSRITPDSPVYSRVQKLSKTYE